MLTDVEYIRNEWSQYYRNLYKDGDCGQEDTFKHSVETEINQFKQLASNETYLRGGPFTITEITKEIKKLKNRKSPGHDAITAEHLKHCGTLSKAALAWALNVIIYTESIPEQLKRGLIVSIPKSNRDATYKTHNRGITLLPVYYKLLERIIISRENEVFDNKQVIDELQGAGQAKCSCLHTSMLLQEAIGENRSKGATVYVVYLDIKKAFDTVWIPGLLHKLMKSGIIKKSMKMIQNGYEQFKCAVYVAGKAGQWFEPERGVHQGAPISMKLYQIYINDLIKEMRR